MSLWHIAWNYLWNRKLTTLLTVMSVALGVALISAVLTLEDETRRRFEEEGRIFDFVVGSPAGSPLQLVLSSIYFMDNPAGNIPYADYLSLREDPDVADAYPIGLGDTFEGFRIVGTTADIYDYRYKASWLDVEEDEDPAPVTTTQTEAATSPPSAEMKPWEDPAQAKYWIKPFNLAEGEWFDQPMEAVLGAMVARKTGKKIGDTFTGTHGTIEISREQGGISHEDHAYTVVGILDDANSPLDRAVFTDIRSFWELHPPEEEEAHLAEAAAARLTPEQRLAAQALAGTLRQNEPCAVCGSVVHPAPAGHPHDEHQQTVTAVVLRLNSPGLQFTFRTRILDEYKLMPAVPVTVISDFYYQFLGVAQRVLISVGFLVVVISAISIMIGLYLAIIQRRRDLAIMRALGASATEIFGAVIIEAFWVTLLGIVAGWVLGAGVSWGVGQYLTQTTGLLIQPFAMPPLLARAMSMVGLVGLLAGILPAMQAYRTDVARDLSAV